MKRIAVFLIGGALLLVPGCSNPRKLVLREQNKESVLKAVSDSKKISEDDKKALNAYLMRIEVRRLVAAEDEKTKRRAREEILKAAGKSMTLSEDDKKAFMAFFELTYKGLGLDQQGACCPAPAYGKTVGEMIEEQKKWQTEQQARFDGLNKLRVHRREPSSPSSESRTSPARPRPTPDSRFWGAIPPGPSAGTPSAGTPARARGGVATAPSWSTDLVVTKSEWFWDKYHKTVTLDETITNRSEIKVYKDLRYEVVLLESGTVIGKGHGVIGQRIKPGETRQFRRLDAGLGFPSQLKEGGFSFKIVDATEIP